MRAQRVRGPIVRVETTVGRPISVDDQEIVPVARSVHVQVPGVSGGLIWNRPVAVLVRAADGTEYQLPVHDVTRRVQSARAGCWRHRLATHVAAAAPALV